MTRNMGTFDRAVRIVVAIIAALLIYNGTLSGGWAIAAGVLAIVFAFTSFVGFCPLYRPLGISTCGRR